MKKLAKPLKISIGDALNMLEDIIKKNLVKPSAVVGFWPANSELDDIIIYENDLRKKILDKFYHLRQQVSRKNSERANFVSQILLHPQHQR